MQFSRLALVLLGKALLASGQDLPDIPSIAPRQFHSITLTTSGQKPPTTSSSTSTSSTSTTSLTSSTTTSSVPSVSSSTGYDLVVTSIFTQPAGCDGGLTAVPSDTDVLWQNIMTPVPSVTVTSCYPPQFYASALATISLPPFQQLVCPYKWQTMDVSSTYRICCPDGFGLYAPNFSDPQRPGLDAICTSFVWPEVLMDVTSYSGTTSTVVPMTAGVNGTLVLASAFDGARTTVTGTPTTSSSAITTTGSSTTTAKTTTTTSTTPTTSKTSSTSTPSTTSTRLTTSTTSTRLTTSTTTTASPTPTAISQLPSCGQLCFSNMLAQYTTLGCGTSDPACLCRNVNFGYGIRDCANGACGASVATTVLAFETSYCASATSARTTYPTTAAPTTTGIAGLPSCGQTCFSNMLAQYQTLGCGTSDPACLCRNVNFGYGIRDCANGACGAVVASTVVSFESTYCASATAARTTFPTTAPKVTGIAGLPFCGQTCFSNMLAQYSTLGCASPDPSCLCKKVNFGNGIRDCANGACGAVVASTVISFESTYCASATAAPLKSR